MLWLRGEGHVKGTKYFERGGLRHAEGRWGAAYLLWLGAREWTNVAGSGQAGAKVQPCTGQCAQVATHFELACADTER